MRKPPATRKQAFYNGFAGSVPDCSTPLNLPFHSRSATLPDAGVRGRCAARASSRVAALLPRTCARLTNQLDLAAIGEQRGQGGCAAGLDDEAEVPRRISRKCSTPSPCGTSATVSRLGNPTRKMAQAKDTAPSRPLQDNSYRNKLYSWGLLKGVRHSHPEGRRSSSFRALAASTSSLPSSVHTE